MKKKQKLMQKYYHKILQKIKIQKLLKTKKLFFIPVYGFLFIKLSYISKHLICKTVQTKLFDLFGKVFFKQTKLFVLNEKILFLFFSYTDNFVFCFQRFLYRSYFRQTKQFLSFCKKLQ